MSITSLSKQFSVAVCLVLTGCAATPERLQNAHEVVRPTSFPVRNITGFTDALRCMDNLLATHLPPGPPALIYSKGVIDKTGKSLGVDNREMLMNTISRMSATSNVFQSTDLPTNAEDASIIDVNFGLANRERAQYEIIAAVSQMDENVSARSRGVTLSLPFLDISTSDDILVTLITVDFLASKPSNGIVLNGISTSNSIAIARSGRAGDVGGQIKKAGFFFNLSLDRSEGVYAAIRALVELSTIEVLGKLAEVPYWRCLQIEQTNPEIMAMTQQWYKKMATQKRIKFVQQMLLRRSAYSGPITGALDTLTRQAISRYQQQNGLLPSGRIDLGLYRSLISYDLGDRTKLATTQPGADHTQLPAAAITPVIKPMITLTTKRGPRPFYQLNDRFSLTAEVSQDTQLYCFYRDAQRQIMRIFPNRFQRQPTLRGKNPITIPGDNRFTIDLDKAGTIEEVLCVASPNNIASAVQHTYPEDLTSLPVQSLQEVLTTIKRFDPELLASQRMQIHVGS